MIKWTSSTFIDLISSSGSPTHSGVDGIVRMEVVSSSAVSEKETKKKKKK